MKFTRPNTKLDPSGEIVKFLFGDGPLIESLMSWFTFGSRLVAEKRGEQMNGPEGRTPSTSEDLPSRVTV